MSVNFHEQINLRSMVEDDIPTVVVNERRAYSFPWNAQHFRDSLSAPNQAWVLTSDGHVIGHAVTSRALDEAQILNICVTPDRQGEGLGRYMLDRLLARMRIEGIRDVFLEVRMSNEAARRLYVSCGFAEVGRRKGYYPDVDGREDAIVMAARLGGD